MIIVMNVSNLQSGGGLQVAASLLCEFERYPQHKFHILYSTPFLKFINTEALATNIEIHFYKNKSNINLVSIFKFQKWADTIVNTTKADIVFTVFGPALWKPLVPHLVGFANGYYMFNNASYIKERIFNSIFKIIKYRAYQKVLMYQLNRESTAIWVETKIAKVQLNTFFNKDIFVIGNTYSSTLKPISKQNLEQNVFTFIYPTAYYKHKNIEILPKIIDKLKLNDIKVKFILTLSDTQYATIFSNKYKDYVENVGSINSLTLNSLYHKSQALFMPSLLETFSANYVEAMYVGISILCSNFSFSNEICGDAAFYFNAQNIDDIVNKIKLLIGDEMLRQQLVENGKLQLKKHETPQSRAQKIIFNLENLSQN